MALNFRCDWSIATFPSYIFGDSLNVGGDISPLRRTSAAGGSLTCYGGVLWLRDRLNLTAVRIDYKWRYDVTVVSNLLELKICFPADRHERIHQIKTTLPLAQIISILHAISASRIGFELNQFWSYWENNCIRVPLGSIRQLDLSHCGLDCSQLAEVDLSRLTSLRVLKLEWNEIGNLPDRFITKLPTSLRTLDLTHNQLTSLPESLGRLAQLQKLLIGQNRLSLMPLNLANPIMRGNGSPKCFPPEFLLSDHDYRVLSGNLHETINSSPQLCPNCNESFSHGCETLTFAVVKSRLGRRVKVFFKGQTCSQACKDHLMTNGWPT